MTTISVSQSDLDIIFKTMYEQISARIEGVSGNLKATKSGKPRKESSNKGVPTAHGDFTKKFLAEHKDEIVDFKAANPEMKSPHFTFLSNYKKEHPEVYEAFKVEWKKAHPSGTDVEPAEVSGADDSIAEVKLKKIVTKRLSVLNTESVTPEKLDTNTVVPTKPVKRVKKAITSEVVTPVQVKGIAEDLPFTMGGIGYLRRGIRRTDGNHLWVSGHLWALRKGVKAHYVGELNDDGSLWQDADEPTF